MRAALWEGRVRLEAAVSQCVEISILDAPGWLVFETQTLPSDYLDEGGRVTLPLPLPPELIPVKRSQVPQSRKQPWSA